MLMGVLSSGPTGLEVESAQASVGYLGVLEGVPEDADAGHVRRHFTCVPCVDVGTNVSLRELIAEADRRLYKAKSAGRNSLVAEGPRPLERLWYQPTADDDAAFRARGMARFAA